MLMRKLIQYDIEKIKTDKACIQTVMDSLRPINDEMTLSMMRIDDIQRAIIQVIVDLEAIEAGDNNA